MNEKLNKTKSETQKAGGVMQGLKGHLAGLLNPTTLAIGAFTALTGVVASSFGEFQKYAGEVRDLSIAAGTTAEETSVLLQVLDDFQISAGDVTAAMRAMKEQGLVPTLDTLAQLSDQFIAIEDPAARLEFAQKNLGRSYSQFLNVLQQGGSVIRANSAEVNKALILTDEQIKKAEEERLALDALSDSWQGLKTSVGSAVGEFILSANESKNATERLWEYAEANDINILNLVKMAKAKKTVIEQIKEEAKWTEYGAAMQKLYGDVIEGEVIPAMEDSEEAMQALSDELQDSLSLIGNIADENRNFAESQADVTKRMQENRAEAAALYPWQRDELQQLNDEYADLQEQYTANADAHHEAMMRIQYDLLMTKLAADGLTESEYQILQQFGLMAGIFDQESIDMANAFNLVSAAVANGTMTLQQMNAILQKMSTGKYTIDVVLRMLATAPAQFNYYASGGTTQTVQTQQGGFASGGVSSGPKSGHWELLHGTEAVIPLEKGSVPVQIEGNAMGGGYGQTADPLALFMPILQAFAGIITREMRSALEKSGRR